MISQLRKLHNYLKPYQSAIFFLLGFLFDLITLNRIDQSLTILQQAAFLLLIGLLLFNMTLHHTTQPSWPRWTLKLWKYRVQALHFLFGSLLSAFSIFYFKSASFFVSFDFMMILIALLIINEFPHFKSLNLSFKHALFTLCLISYFSYFIPILINSIGTIPFLLGLTVSGLVLWGMSHLLLKRGLPASQQKSSVLIPSSITFIAFALLYFLKILPPVPLSAQYMGIYHGIKKEGSDYRLEHEKAFWKIWQHGDQKFIAQPEDRIYCFVRIFSPADFKEKIFFHWLYKHPKLGWKSTDRIPVEILGGRSDGYRAYAYKSKYEPGKWRVQVETSDKREIARMYFVVKEDTNPQRERFFKYDYY